MMLNKITAIQHHLVRRLPTAISIWPKIFPKLGNMELFQFNKKKFRIFHWSICFGRDVKFNGNIFSSSFLFEWWPTFYSPMFVVTIWRKLSICDTYMLCCCDEYYWWSLFFVYCFETAFRKNSTYFGCIIDLRTSFSLLSLSYSHTHTEIYDISISLIAKKGM